MSNSLYVQGVLGVAKVFLINIVGFVFGRYPRKFGLLNPSFVKDLSRVVIYILLPCLIFFSVGSAFDPGEFSSLWPLCIWAMLNLLISFLIAKLCSTIIPQFSMFFQITIILSNTVNLPLLVLESVCDNDPVDPVTCFAEYGTFAFTYSIALKAVLWGVVYPYFKRMKKREEILMRIVNPDAHADKVLDSTSIEMDEIDVAHPIDCNLIATAEEQRQTDMELKKDHNCWYIIQQFLHCNNTALIIGFVVGSWAWLQSVLFDPSSSVSIFGLTAKTIGFPAILLSSLIIGATLAHAIADIDFSKVFWDCFRPTTTSKENPADCKEIQIDHPPVLIMITCIFARLVIIPTIMMLSLYAVSFVSFLSPIFPSEPKLLLFLTVEFASPSALICVIFTSELGFKQQSRQIAFMYLFMYFIATFTMSGFLSLSSLIFSL